MKSLLLAAILCQAVAVRGAEPAAAKPASANPALTDIERKLTDKQRELKEGRLKAEEYAAWEEPVRADFKEASARVERTPENTAAAVRIGVLLGDAASAHSSLDRALEDAPHNSELLRTKGLLLYEAGDYPGAAKHGLEAWERSGRTDQSALALYQMTKGRAAPTATPAVDSISPKTARGSPSPPPTVEAAVKIDHPAKANVKLADVPLPPTEDDPNKGLGLLTALGAAAGVLMIAWGALPKETKDRYSALTPVAGKANLAAHWNDSVSPEEFLDHYRGRTLEEISHEADVGGEASVNAGGPADAFRYVRMPNETGVVIDMRHFLVVGRMGNVPGLGIEVQQSLHGFESAFQSQDFVSNYYGAKFFSSYDPAKPFDRQLVEFFKSSENFRKQVGQ